MRPALSACLGKLRDDIVYSLRGIQHRQLPQILPHFFPPRRVFQKLLRRSVKQFAVALVFPKDDCRTVLVDCPQFTTRRYALTKPFVSDCSDIDSFVIFIAYEGAALLRDAQGAEVSLKAGEAVLFPASNASVTIEPQTPRFACLDTYCR